MRAKILKASLLAMLLASTALADTSSMNADRPGMGILENNWIRAGVNGTTGTFGSGGGTTPGLLFDPTGTGTFDPSYDYLTPGSPFDGFAVKIDGENKVNNNAGNMNQIPNCDCRMGETMFDGNNYLIWGGMWEHGGGTWEINNTYTLGETNPYVDVETEIIAGSNATTLSFGKFIDPDSQGMPGDSSSTDNVLGYGVIPSTNVAFSEATVSRYALGLYTTDTNVTAGINGWSTQADGYNGTTYTDADGNPVNYGNGDDTIGISWTWTGVSAGDILTASYAYIFGPSAFDAASDAIEGGAGGGADVSSWGTLEDVGSATDAASGGGSTPEPVITTETIVDTSRPVLTASITHHESSVAEGVQTIARETTTTTTTPMVTNTYTDGTLTSSAVATSTVSTAVTDPGSFTGRMDQADAMLGLNIGHGLGFVQGFAGGRTSHSMDNGNSAETTQFGFGHTIATDDGLAITGGLNFADTTMTGTDGTGEMSTTHFGAAVGKALDGRDMTIGIEGNMATTDLSYSRTIGDFSAAGTTSQSDMWGTFTVEKSTGAVRPWAGYTIGKRSTDAWTETGDIQAVLENPGSDETYNYASVGLNIEAGLLDLGISKAFDAADTTKLSVGVDRQINDRIAVSGAINRTMAGDNESTFMSAGIKLNF
jgi:hypothetical protein